MKQYLTVHPHPLHSDKKEPCYMDIKITKHLLSIPPYVSSRWEFIQSLRVQEQRLIVTLKDGSSCTVPSLSQEELSQIFIAFSSYAQQPEGEEVFKKDISQLVEGMKKGFSEFVNMITKASGQALGFAKSLEHDPSNAHLPPLPPEARKRVEMLLQIVPEDEILAMHEPIADCHCMYCQVQRLLREAISRKKHPTEEEEEPVDESELKFTEWTVEPLADKLYSVRNKLNPQEEYRVFLGEPLGCTCGKANCEHIIAVLRS